MQYRSSGEGQPWLPQYVRIFEGISSTAVRGVEAGPEKLFMVAKNKLLTLLPKC